MKRNIGGMRWGKWSAALAVAVLGLATAGAQMPGGGPDGPMGHGPGGDDMGMGPHRPPMERAMGSPDGRGGDHGRWWNEPRVVDKLKLTDVQRKAMDDIFQQHRLTLVDLRATLEKAELSMEPMIQEDQPDEGKILAQIDKVAQARAELEKANARMLFDLRKQLTPDQWKQIQAFRDARRDSWGDGNGPGGAGARWHGHGGGGPGGPNGPAGQAPAPAPAPSGPGEDQ